MTADITMKGNFWEKWITTLGDSSTYTYFLMNLQSIDNISCLYYHQLFCSLLTEIVDKDFNNTFIPQYNVYNTM